MFAWPILLSMCPASPIWYHNCSQKWNKKIKVHRIQPPNRWYWLRHPRRPMLPTVGRPQSQLSGLWCRRHGTWCDSRWPVGAEQRQPCQPRQLSGTSGRTACSPGIGGCRDQEAICVSVNIFMQMSIIMSCADYKMCYENNFILASKAKFHNLRLE